MPWRRRTGAGTRRLADMELILPTPAHLPLYEAALERGWSPDTMRTDQDVAAREERARIDIDPQAFLDGHEDPQAAAGPVTLPDGSQVARLPGIRRWIWDQGDFCGSIGLRWPADFGPLPPHVPWQRGRGLATQALALMLKEAAWRGLRSVELTTDTDNLPSQKVITANGGVLLRRFTKPAAFGGAESLLYRIDGLVG